MTAHGEAHLRVLQALEGAGHVSQRALADSVGMAASQVNRVIQSLLAERHLRVADDTVRPYAYALTPDGQAQLRRLSYARYAAVVDDYRRVEARIRDRLGQLVGAGVERVAFYGAGDILDVTLPLACEVGLEVAGVVDDDPARQGTTRGALQVGPPTELGSFLADAVIVTSFRHAERIRERLSSDPFMVPRVVEL